jgi:hypothetical protein
VSSLSRPLGIIAEMPPKAVISMSPMRLLTGRERADIVSLQGR